MKYTLFILSIILFPSALYADAKSGELFGYKIGNTYPLRKNIKHGHNIWNQTYYVKVEASTKPRDIDSVLVTITPKTHTIGEIFSVNDFKNVKTAFKFSYKYSEILSAKYRPHNPFVPVPNKGKNTILAIQVSDKYILRIRRFKYKNIL